MTEMTSIERVVTTLSHREPDRVPLFSLMMFFPANRAGTSYRQYATDCNALVDAQINLFENYCVDALTVSTDAYVISADIGVQMEYPEEQTPFAVEHFVRTENEFRALRRPDPFK